MGLHRFNTFNGSSTPKKPTARPRRATTFSDSTSPGPKVNQQLRRNAYHSQGVLELVAYATEEERSTRQCRKKAQEIFNLATLPPQSTISGMLKRNNIVLKKDGGKGRNIKIAPALSPVPKTGGSGDMFFDQQPAGGINLDVRIEHIKRKRLSIFPEMESLILSTTFNFLLHGTLPTTDMIGNAIEPFKPEGFNRSQFQRILDKYVLTCNLKSVESDRMPAKQCIETIIRHFPQIDISKFNSVFSPNDAAAATTVAGSSPNCSSVGSTPSSSPESFFSPVPSQPATSSDNSYQPSEGSENFNAAFNVFEMMGEQDIDLFNATYCDLLAAPLDFGTFQLSSSASSVDTPHHAYASNYTYRAHSMSNSPFDLAFDVDAGHQHCHYHHQTNSIDPIISFSSIDYDPCLDIF